jgi:hypothetical protein
MVGLTISGLCDWVDSVVIGPVLPADVDEYLQRVWLLIVLTPMSYLELKKEKRPRQQQRGGREVHRHDDFDIDVGLDDLNNHYDDEVYDDD